MQKTSTWVVCANGEYLLSSTSSPVVFIILCWDENVLAFDVWSDISGYVESMLVASSCDVN